MKPKSNRVQNTRQDEFVAVLEDELAALRIWQSAKNSRGALALPTDIWDGMTISIDKIETVLRKKNKCGTTEISGRNKHGEECRE